MANIQERRDKSGKLISYSIRVHRGRGADGKQLKPWTATFEVAPTWTEKSAKKKAEAFAATFEKECRAGVTSDSRQTFQSYCDYVIDLKESRGAKHRTIQSYKGLTERIYPELGHIKLKDLRADHLNDFYTMLGKEGTRKRSAKVTAKVDLSALLKEKKATRSGIALKAGIGSSTVCAAVKGKTVTLRAGQAIADALGVNMDKIFTVHNEAGVLSAKTITEYHRLIHTVLEQAVKEGLIPFNMADRVTLPKVTHKEVTYFQPGQIAAIQDALKQEPIKWHTLVHLLMITGARRGEILGLKWDKVDFERNQIYICNNIGYSPDIGVFEGTPKTEKSKRYVALPAETMQLLKKYRAWQAQERLRLGGYYQDQGFIFARDDGRPMHPDSVGTWLTKFSKRHSLPHINPHAFRHTMASMLYFNGVDSVSISKRLGHAQVSTTANIYAHVMEEADQRNADILAEVFLKKA